jgi:hypothetical protein
MCARYNTIDRTLEQTNGRISTEKAMSLLKDVSQHGAVNTTIFSMVYNMINGEIDIAVDRKFDRLYHYGLNMQK